MASSQDRVQHLTQKLTNYCLMFQKCSDYIRVQDTSATKQQYDEAYQEWQSASNPLNTPPLGDENQRAAFLAQCDEICHSEPKTMKDHFKIGFACAAGMQTIHNQELAGMGDEKLKIMRNSGELAVEQYLKEHPDQAMSTGSSIPPHLVSALFPDHASRADNELGPHLIDQRVRYRDPQTGMTMDCTVQDCGTSHLKGEWYEVVYDDDDTTAMQVTAKEMKEMLVNRVSQVSEN